MLEDTDLRMSLTLVAGKIREAHSHEELQMLDKKRLKILNMIVMVILYLLHTPRKNMIVMMLCLITHHITIMITMTKVKRHHSSFLNILKCIFTF